jgi:hypothetical protein
MGTENPGPGATGTGAGIDTEQRQVLDTRLSSKPQGWRDLVSVHPASDLFPTMTDNELDVLAADIVKHGLRVRLVFLGDQLLDGRNRLAAICRIPNARRRDRFLKRVQERKDCLVLPDGGTDPWAFVISANIYRRHLDREQKRELIETLLRATPERSDNATAKLAKVSDKTVTAVRHDLEGRSEIPNVSTRIDAAGRQQPASKPPKPLGKEATIRAMREQQFASSSESATNRFGIADELEQVLRILRGDRSRIAQIPLAKRIALARGCLNLLDVTLDDLRPIGDGP